MINSGSSATLVLSGGGALGAAHLGALQALSEKQISYERIIGVSAGALAGALIASGHSPQAAWSLVKSTKLLSLFYDFSKGFGLLGGKKIHALLDKIFEGRQFTDLKTPLVVGVTDFSNGKFLSISSGSVADALRASISVPVLFQPFFHPELKRWLVDGGITNNFPVDLALELTKNAVVAIDVATSLDDKLDFGTGVRRVRKNLNQALIRTLRIFLLNQQAQLKIPERVTVYRPDLSKYSATNVFKLDEIWQRGFECVSAA